MAFVSIANSLASPFHHFPLSYSTPSPYSRIPTTPHFCHSVSVQRRQTTKWNRRQSRWFWISSYSVFAIALILCLACSGRKSVVYWLPEVIDLNDDNFELLTQMNSGSTTGRWFVKFYAPVWLLESGLIWKWCGHCKKLAPIWEDLADALEGEVNVAQVDATENAILSDLYEIEGFPTLYFFENVRSDSFVHS